MIELTARKLLDYTTEQLEDLLAGYFILKFDNGEKVSTNAVETIYSSYIWDMIRSYPETPLLPQHHIRHHLRKINFGSKTTIACYTEIFRTLIQTYKNNPAYSRNEMMRRFYQVNNNLYNKLHTKVLPWAVSLDILDFKVILDDPDVRHVKATMEINPKGIEQAQNDITNILLKSEKLNDSVIARGVRADILSKGQVAKCIGPCGYITDVDSYIFPKPVLRGYAEGIRSFYDSLIESRSGAKSLEFSKKPLQDTEYFSRRLQLVTMVVKNLHFTDCGTDKYMLWYVRPDEFDEEGRKIRSSDLSHLAGKYYLDTETNTLKTISPDDKHLIGTWIKMRSVLHCNHDDPYGVCSTCFGELAYGVPEGANLGHLCTVTMASPVSQAVLSVKHLDRSAVVDGVYVSDYDKLFIVPANAGQSYKFNKAGLKHKPKLVLHPKVSKMLTSLNDVDDVRDLNITRVTEFEDITIEYYAKPPAKDDNLDLLVTERRVIPVSIKRRLASFTHEFLDHIKRTGWTYDHKNNIVIDLEGWESDKLFMTLPLKHHSMADHSAEIEKLIESSVKTRKGGTNNVKPSDLLVQLFDLVNGKTSVNISVLETVIYATSIVSSEEFDYNLPKERNISEFGVASKIMMYRSTAAAMAYEGHIETLSDPVNYLITDKPNHPFDALVVPELMKH